MSNRLYGDLLQSSGRRFYFALDGAPGIITPSPAVLSIQSLLLGAAQPTTVFRTPAPATLTFSALAPGAPVILAPATGSISTVGQSANQVRSLTITPAIPAPLENPPASFAPTIVYIQTKTPAPATLVLSPLPFNLTQGGNIGFVSPAAAQVSLGVLPYTLLLGGQIGLGSLLAQGLAPTLTYELTIHPEVGAVQLSQAAPNLALPFTWVDDDPAPTRTWITDAAA